MTPGTGTPENVASLIRICTRRGPGAGVRASLPVSLLIVSMGLAGCVAQPPAPDADGRSTHEEAVSAFASDDPGSPPVSNAAHTGRPPHTTIDGRKSQWMNPAERLVSDGGTGRIPPHTHRGEDTPGEPDAWTRIRNGITLPHPLPPRVTREIRWYGKNQAYIHRLGHRARPYLPYIVQEVEKRGLPIEFALLPVVESAFRVSAYSHKGALGLWQFIPSTGRLYGLKQNWWYDGRRDVVASTRAALDYLSKLMQDFNGDRLLAAAAYNWGEGNVRRSMSRNRARGKPTDVWSLRLPRETRAHVSRLLAFAAIVKEPDKYGVVLEPIRDHVPFEPVALAGQIDLSVAADLAGITLNEIFRFNPGFKRGATAPKGPHLLQLPSGAVEQFRTNLAKLQIEKRMRWTNHKIVRGDTLGAIARRYRTTVTELMSLNRLTSDRILAGRTLMVPVSPSPDVISDVVHVVESGDTLSGIAARHGTTVLALTEFNRINKGSILRPGQKLRLIPAAYTKASETRESIRYRVKRGDSLWRISRQFGVSVASLREWNQMSKGEPLIAGRELDVYVGRAPAI